MVETKLPAKVDGLTCYYIRYDRDNGRIREVKYRPTSGPWTPALRNKVPPHQRGSALEEQPAGRGAAGDVAGPSADATSTRRATINRGALAAERRAKQGNLEL